MVTHTLTYRIVGILLMKIVIDFYVYSCRNYSMSEEYKYISLFYEIKCLFDVLTVCIWGTALIKHQNVQIYHVCLYFPSQTCRVLWSWNIIINNYNILQYLRISGTFAPMMLSFHLVRWFGMSSIQNNHNQQQEMHFIFFYAAQ